jgi:hypothetical protein
MEVLLNLLWFALCNLAAWHWLQRWRRGNQRRSMAVQLSALACLLVLLFPVISATDDLYAAQLALETSDTQKSSKGSLSGKSSFPQVNHHARSAALPRTLSLSADVCVGTIAADDALPFCRASISHPPQDRAPPFRPLFF